MTYEVIHKCRNCEHPVIYDVPIGTNKETFLAKEVCLRCGNKVYQEVANDK